MNLFRKQKLNHRSRKQAYGSQGGIGGLPAEGPEPGVGDGIWADSGCGEVLQKAVKRREAKSKRRKGKT